MALERLIRVLRSHQEDPNRIYDIYRAAFACGSPEHGLLMESLETCDQAHQGQIRHLTGEEYANHPKIVSGGILGEYLCSTDVNELSGANVHDVPEDNLKWPYARLAGRLGSEVATIADWCNRNRFKHILDKDERDQRFLENLLLVAPITPVRIKVAEKLHNAMTPYKLGDDAWVEEEICCIQTYYLAMSKKCGGMLYNELIEVIEALKRRECLLPPIKPKAD
ncbi:MAG: HD domain-containing protein [Patescibacteria group bacterium]